MLPIVQDFGIFAPFAFSPCWIFSALRRTSRVSRHGGLEHSVTFRPVADTLAKHVRLRSLPVPASRHRRAAKLNFCFQPLGAGLLASLSNISLLLRRSRSANVPTFGAPPGEGAAAAAHRGIVGNGVFGGGETLTRSVVLVFMFKEKFGFIWNEPIWCLYPEDPVAIVTLFRWCNWVLFLFKKTKQR